MSAATTFSRAYKLPFGYVAEFRIDFSQIRRGEVNARGLICEWDPHIPVFRSERARQKFPGKVHRCA